jgi:AcrR family transcriptional regulator
MHIPKKNRRYRQVLVTAKELFWKHGFKRVTVEEISREAGVSKMTFYRFFPNKIALARAVYDMVITDGYEKFKALMDNPDYSPIEKIEGILLMKLEGLNDMSREFMQDFYSNPQLGLASYVEERSREIWVRVIDDFKRAQEMGWMRKDFKPEGMYMFMMRFMDIVNDEKMMMLYNTPQELVMELSKFFIYGIMPRDSGRPGGH